MMGLLAETCNKVFVKTVYFCNISSFVCIVFGLTELAIAQRDVLSRSIL
jgi:hypothetical protein